MMLEATYENDDLKRKARTMSTVKFTALIILATLILGAGESSTALAAHEFVVEGKAIAKGSKVEVRGSGGVALEGSIAALSSHIGCGEGLLPVGTSNVLEEAGKFKSKIELKACGTDDISAGVEEDEPKCKVPNFNVESTGELIEGGVASVSGSGTEKSFATIKIEEVSGAGACAVAGEFALKGATTCDVPDYLVTSPGFLIACNPLGGKEVKLGKETTKLDLTLGIEGTKGQTFSSN
jgi:hypothetical protein